MSKYQDMPSQSPNEEQSPRGWDIRRLTGGALRQDQPDDGSRSLRIKRRSNDLKRTNSFSTTGALDQERPSARSYYHGAYYHHHPCKNGVFVSRPLALTTRHLQRPLNACCLLGSTANICMQQSISKIRPMAMVMRRQV
jgi:hypothetical protein